MNRSLLIPVIGFSLLGFAAGCNVEERTTARPPDRVEVMTARPSPEHVWIRGHWDRRGESWSWTEGRWERR